MKKNLLIVGAGGHGRCCLDIAREANNFNKICYLDDGLVGNIINGAEVLDTIENLCKYKETFQEIFVAIGNNSFRKIIQQEAEFEGFTITNLFSKRSYISEYANIGKGCVVFPGAVIESNVTIGDGCIVAANATINHDAIMEDYTLVYSNSVIRPNSIIKELTRIGSSCVVSFGEIVEEESDIPDGTVV